MGFSGVTMRIPLYRVQVPRHFSEIRLLSVININIGFVIVSPNLATCYLMCEPSHSLNGKQLLSFGEP